MSRRSAAARRCDGLLDGEDAPGLLDVEVLDHPAVNGNHAAAVRLRLLERGDDATGTLHLIGGRSESGIARLDLTGMDEGLPVEAHLASLPALGREAGLVFDVVVDAVEDHLAVRPGREQTQPESTQQWMTPGHARGAQFLHEV